MSDRTPLQNFAGDMKEWPVYMTNGNLSSKIRQMPSTHSVLMVPLLPIAINYRKFPQKQLYEQRQTHQGVLNIVLRRILQLLTFKQISAPRAGITTFYVPMATSGIANWF